MGSTLLQQLELSYFLIGPVAFLAVISGSIQLYYLPHRCIPSICSLPVHSRHSYTTGLLGFFCSFDFALFISWYKALSIVLYVYLAENITSTSYNP